MDNKDIAVEVKSSISEINDFLCTPEMQSAVAELWSLDEADRAVFVQTVLLDPRELAKRNIFPPHGLIIQRSAFRDNRPTLFCVTKHLPPGLGWKKVTVTFDNSSGLPDLAYSDFRSQSVPGADSFAG